MLIKCTIIRTTVEVTKRSHIGIDIVKGKIHARTGPRI
jgi:hypothetical protein